MALVNQTKIKQIPMVPLFLFFLLKPLQCNFTVRKVVQTMQFYKLYKILNKLYIYHFSVYLASTSLQDELFRFNLKKNYIFIIFFIIESKLIIFYHP